MRNHFNCQPVNQFYYNYIRIATNDCEKRGRITESIPFIQISHALFYCCSWTLSSVLVADIFTEDAHSGRPSICLVACYLRYLIILVAAQTGSRSKIHWERRLIFLSFDFVNLPMILLMLERQVEGSSTPAIYNSRHWFHYHPPTASPYRVTNKIR